MKIYKVDFEPVYPVGCCLIIAANTIGEAKKIAARTIAHTKEFTVKEVKIDEPKVIEYQSGDY
jgi:hypothetical protein